ncbi:RDD family protein [Paenibacillus sp. 22594]|uniref:RDD family protein n=1 Tax=Paenibacillus sp. 22594 TaxID=3453947 RepID=UPI003F86871F
MYFVSLTTIYNQTLGKMIVGIKVRTFTDEKPSWEDVLLREGIGKGISACIFFIGYLMAAFDPTKRALHDHLTNMVVVWEANGRKAVHSPFPNGETNPFL